MENLKKGKNLEHGKFKKGIKLENENLKRA